MVRPRLLAEALGQALGLAVDVDVTVIPEAGRRIGERIPLQFDIAVVSDGLNSVAADVVIELPDSAAGSGVGTLRRDCGHEPVMLENLAAVGGLVRRLAEA